MKCQRCKDAIATAVAELDSGRAQLAAIQPETDWSQVITALKDLITPTTEQGAAND